MGTAFLIIIPEALHNIFQDHSSDVDSSWAPGYIGYVLAGGFIVMIIFEKLSHACLSTQDSTPTSTHPFSSLLSPASISIILHDITDGWALGLVFLNGSSRGLLIWLAIVLHKAPTSFAIGSLLLSRDTPSSNIVRVQSCFSAVAPLSALLTHAGARALSSAAPSPAFVGLCLLFSAGTFLYTIAAHVLPEVLHGDSGHLHMPGDGHSHDYQRACLLEPSQGHAVNALHAAGAHAHMHARCVAEGECHEYEYARTRDHHYPQPVHMVAMLAGVATPALFASGHHH
jgi:zinc transporter ZupT